MRALSATPPASAALPPEATQAPPAEATDSPAEATDSPAAPEEEPAEPTAQALAQAAAGAAVDVRPARVKFRKKSGLRAELNRRVDAYFEETGISSASEGAAMWFKTLFLITTLATAWATLMIFATAWWQLVALAVVAGFAMAGIGFCVMHDGSHGAYSKSKAWNRIMASTLDLIGGSSYMWRFKHNVLHHTYPNIEGLDDDIEAQPFLRMAEGQRYRPWHALQHIYLWAAYALLPVKWHFVDDYRSILTGKINGQSFVRPKGAELALFLFGKSFFYTWVLVLPLLYHSPLWVLAAYAIMASTAGVTLGTVFQLAHCVEGVEFTEIPMSGQMDNPWAEHQLATTANFSPKSRFLTWYLGGLNYQVEHHLFPRVGHTHYPAISKIVQEVCAEFGVKHRTQPTLWNALAAHVGYLKSLGHPAPMELT